MSVNRRIKIVLLCILCLGLFAALSACAWAEDNKPPVPIRINQPKELSPKLAKTEFLLTKNENDETSAHITTLDRKKYDFIKLDLEGGGVELSPNGKYLVFEYGKVVDSEDRSGIWIRHLESGQEQEVFLWPEPSNEAYITSPSFSSDNTHIIFSISWFLRETVGLGKVDMDGKNLLVLETEGSLNRGPVYSPDGKKILVMCGGRDKDTGQPGFMLCIMDSDGSNRRMITEDGDTHGSYHFTPDSEHIIYSESEFGGILGVINQPYYRIMTMDTRGDNKRTILNWDKPVGILKISNDGEEIIFFEHDYHPLRIFVINRDGTNLRHLAYFDDFLTEWFPEKD